MAGEEQLHDFVEQAGDGFFFQTACVFGNRRGGALFDGETEFARQPHGAQHAHGVFLIAFGRIAYHHEAAGFDVGHAVVEIVDFVFYRVEVEGVAGEITPAGVFGQRAVGVVLHDAAVFVLHRAAAAAEGGDFDGFRADLDVDDAEAAADDAAAAEEGAHFFGRGVGGDVEVFRFGADQQVAHRAADDIGFVACLLQAGNGFFGGQADVARAQAVFGMGNGLFGACGGRFARHFAPEFFQHACFQNRAVRNAVS
ncbi:hypothetical protein HMPREF9120_02682 [Neisseria sp. oral taxon 020 str. F0370]|nr:hypothetical protein HMPREF9120_02682 [Neisseria sp. oral taxon 020 str. F0370]